MQTNAHFSLTQIDWEGRNLKKIVYCFGEKKTEIDYFWQFVSRQKSEIVLVLSGVDEFPLFGVRFGRWLFDSLQVHHVQETRLVRFGHCLGHDGW